MIMIVSEKKDIKITNYYFLWRRKDKIKEIVNGFSKNREQSVS